MDNTQQRFSLEELASLSGLTRRTVRFYIQEGLVDRPEGAGRGAHYTPAHLEQLLTVRKWQQAGVSLEKIRALTAPDSALGELAALADRPAPGSIEVRSHVTLAEGLELVVSPAQADLSAEQLRSLAKRLPALLEEIRREASSDD